MRGLLAAPREARAGRRTSPACVWLSARALLALTAGALWWGVALRYGLRPGGVGRWEGALFAGWSLGLIPVHAVAVRHQAAGDGTPLAGPPDDQFPVPPVGGTGPR